MTSSEGFRGGVSPLLIAGDPAGGHVVIDATGVHVYDNTGAITVEMLTGPSSPAGLVGILEALEARVDRLQIGSDLDVVPETVLVIQNTGGTFPVDVAVKTGLTFHKYFDTAATPLDNGGQLIPRGELGYAEITAIDTGAAVATQTDVPGLSVTFTLDYATRIESTYKGILTSTVATDTAQCLLVDPSGPTNLDSTGAQNCSGAATKWQYTVRESLAAGTYTRKVQRARVAGTGQVRVNASATQHSFIHVKDIGG